VRQSAVQVAAELLVQRSAQAHAYQVNVAESHVGAQGLTVTGAKPVVWLASTNDPRALQKSSPATDRVAGGWTGDQFSFNLDLLGPNTVSLYAVDWDGQNLRKERIDIVDRISGKLLDSETVGNFAHGTYVTWTLNGHLQVRVVSLNPSWTAAVSGVSLDPPAAH
jgi:hypothetical protein